MKINVAENQIQFEGSLGEIKDLEKNKFIVINVLKGLIDGIFPQYSQYQQQPQMNYPQQQPMQQPIQYPQQQPVETEKAKIGRPPKKADW